MSDYRDEEQAAQAVEAWHWIRADRMLRDGQLVEVGRTYRLPDGQMPILCERGYHASRFAFDALAYAPGPILCRVRLSGTIIEGPDGDKLVASERTVLWMEDASHLLHMFACDVAEQALNAVEAHGGIVDVRSRAAIVAKRSSLAGTITTADLAAARAAAWAAAPAAWDALTRDFEGRVQALMSTMPTTAEQEATR